VAWRSSPKPDALLVKAQLQGLQYILKTFGPRWFMRWAFWIVPRGKKKVSGKREPQGLIPFSLNRVQEHIESTLGQRNLDLKTRQEGGTTYFQARRIMLPAITDGGIGCLSISQNSEYAQKHFQITRRMYKYIAAKDPYAGEDVNALSISLKQNLLHTTYSNRRELIFDQIESQIMLASAEVEEAGQGVSIHHVLADEYSRWPKDPEATLSNVAGAMPPWGTLDKVCTANGAAGPFFEDCLRAMNDAAKSDAVFHFHPWWWTDDLIVNLTEKEAREMEADLEAASNGDFGEERRERAVEERHIVEQIHRELKDVTWLQGMQKLAWRRVGKLQQRGNFDEKYPEDPITAFLVSGNQYFDHDVLIARKRELVGFKPILAMHNGQVRFFNKRIPGRRYVIGADVCQGLQISTEDTDYAAAVVIDLETGEECAALRARLTPANLAYDLAELGRHYNNAIIAVERNADGGACILTLQGECKYSAIYRHKEWWRRERKTKYLDFEGFPTTPKTRPVALDFLNRFVLEHPDLIWDDMFINEALVFVRDEKGIPKAQEGAHDDTVACRWVAHFVRQVLLGYWNPEQARSAKYVPADQLTDVMIPT
jgi:hypothetical protein